MERRILLITKPPEFDSKGEVVLGQCEPFTSGWELRLITTDGEWETLATGTYADLRKIQEACTPISSSDEIRRKVEAMKPLLLMGSTETLVMKAETELSPGLGGEDAPITGKEAYAASGTQREDEREPKENSEGAEIEGKTEKKAEEAGDRGGEAAVSGGEREVGKSSEETDRILVTVETAGQGGVVASIHDPSLVADIGALNNMLNTLLQQSPRAIVLDLGCITTLSSRTARELGRFRDECKNKGCRFVLGAVKRSVRKVLDLIELPEPIELYESLEDAVGAAEKHCRGSEPVS